MRRAIPLRSLTLLLATLCIGGCGSEPETAPPETPPETSTSEPEHLFSEALCDHWFRRDRPCVDEEIETAHAECMEEKGRAARARANSKKHVGRLAKGRMVKRAVNLCLELRGWRKTPYGKKVWNEGY